MEAVLGIAPSGTYDDCQPVGWEHVRALAVRTAELKYLLLKRAESTCTCGRCEDVKAVQLEDEP